MAYTGRELIAARCAKFFNDGDFVNNYDVMSDVSQSFSSDFFGGQNYLAVLLDAASYVYSPETTQYDMTVSTQYRTEVMKFIKGETDTYDDALKSFFKTFAQ